MCYMCDRKDGYDVTMFGGDVKAVNIGALGKLLMSMSLFGNDGDMTLLAELDFPRQIDSRILAEISVEINYCPMCGRKLREADLI